MPQCFNFTECDKNKGYYIIPDFDTYAIAIDGTVINRTTRKQLTPITVKPSKGSIKGGYLLYRLKRFGIIHHRGRHVLLCRAFKKMIPKHNIVNHINGIPGDDDLSNLEWSTYSKNVKHAYDNGLYPNKVVSVVIKHVDTGFSHYNTITAAAEALGYPHATLRSRLLRSPKVMYTDGWGIGTDEVGWSDKVKSVRETYPVYATNRLTGECVAYASVNAAATALRFCSKTVLNSLGRTPSIVGDYTFRKVL